MAVLRDKRVFTCDGLGLIGRMTYRPSAWDRVKTLMLGTAFGVLATGITYLILAGMFE